MKKLITLLLILTMAFALTSCWGEKDPGDEGGSEGGGNPGGEENKGWFDPNGWT